MAIERNAYRSVEFKAANFVKVIGFIGSSGFNRVRSSLMLCETNSEQMGSEYLKWLIASGGWIVAIFTVWVGYRERRDAREEDTLREALSYFTGGTQKRSIGIAFLEGKFLESQRFQDIWVPVIANQFVYLLVQTKPEDKAHEIRNLVRMFRLLSTIKDFAHRYHGSYGDVLDAINNKIEGEERGLNIGNSTLQKWHESLDTIT